MQFFVYDPHYNPEAAPPPNPEFMEAMNTFVKETIAAGVLVATGGLPPKGTRLKLKDGQFTVTDGPFI